MCHRIKVWISVAWLLFGTSATAGADATFEQRLDAAFAELEKQDFSLIVGISRGNEPIIYREFGAAKQDGIPANATQVDLNSITKTVTGVMVLKLVEQGKVRLDETLGEVFPAVPADKKTISIHHLLTHSAGFVESIGPDEEQLSREAFLERVFQSKLQSRPGERYRYSNAGFSILAAIIEKRSGKTYEDYLRQDVVASLGLKSTGYQGVYDESRSLRTLAGKPIMAASWGGHAPYWNLVGNGGIVSTAEEFIRFRQAVTSGQIVGSEWVGKSQQPHIKEDASGKSHYGYGLVVQENPKLGRFYWHDGGNDVFSAMWVDCPERGAILFTAAADAKDHDAIGALRLILKRLYGS